MKQFHVAWKKLSLASLSNRRNTAFYGNKENNILLEFRAGG
jgi:hypothetical protein